MDIIEEVQKLIDENERLIKENLYFKEICEKLKAREKLYMSTLQHTKNQLERMSKSITTTPHSSDEEYALRFYESNEVQ